MAKHLGRVPIPGSHVEAHGLRFEAEAATGRRNKIGTVLISRVEPDGEPDGRPTKESTDAVTLSAEDAKLVTLARATRARVGAAEGAAVRDADGRTYAAATVDLPSLQLSALQVLRRRWRSRPARGASRRRSCSPRPTSRPRPTWPPLGDFGGAGVTVHAATRAARCAPR